MSDGEDGQQDAEGGSDDERGKDKGRFLTRSVVSKFVAAIVAFLVDAREIWPESHVFALALFVLTSFVLMLPYRRLPMGEVFGITAIVAVIALAVYLITPTPPPQIGWLQPGDLPTPSNGCDQIHFPADTSIIVIGDNGIPLIAGQRIIALKVGECPSVTLQQNTEGAVVSAQIYGQDGTRLGTIKDNKYSFPPQSRLTIERSPDLTTLVVHDRNDQELLNVTYMNPHAFRIRGAFTCPIPRLQTVIAKMGSIAGASTSQNCIGGGLVGIHVD